MQYTLLGFAQLILKALDLVVLFRRKAIGANTQVCMVEPKALESGALCRNLTLD